MSTSKRNTIYHILHPYKPVFSPTSKILILGTIPSLATIKNGFYFMHNQSKFWLVMEKIFHMEFQYKITEGQRAADERKNFLLKHDIALWDVLKSCDIKGYGERYVKDPTPNNFSDIFKQANIAQIFCIGEFAYKFWNSLCKDIYNKSAVCLPAPSAGSKIYWDIDKLVEEYKKAILPFLGDKNNLQEKSK